MSDSHDGLAEVLELVAASMDRHADEAGAVASARQQLEVGGADPSPMPAETAYLSLDSVYRRELLPWAALPSNLTAGEPWREAASRAEELIDAFSSGTLGEERRHWLEEAERQEWGRAASRWRRRRRLGIWVAVLAPLAWALQSCF